LTLDFISFEYYEKRDLILGHIQLQTDRIVIV